jgi:hypothetical protein
MLLTFPSSFGGSNFRNGGVKPIGISSIAMRTSLTYLFFLLSSNLIGQHLDVEGHSKIRGNLDINHMDDTTSIFIGRKAGVNTNFAYEKSNTFVGVLAGFTNTNGASNSLLVKQRGGWIAILVRLKYR